MKNFSVLSLIILLSGCGPVFNECFTEDRLLHAECDYSNNGGSNNDR